jgi:bifunctional DNase/RNase
MIRLRILGITFSQVQAGAYALILAEEGGKRRIPIIIGTPEAQSIAIFLEGLNPPRPLTHDLFITFAQAVNVGLKQVNIHKYSDGIFFSEIIFDNGGKTFRLDARTSDAIALAVRTQAPIFITEEIMKEVSILTNDEDDDFWDNIEEQPEKKSRISFESMNLEDLQIQLNEAIASEDYEKASSIRDLINQKSSK